jgi:Cu2+-exporting ATPase
VSEALVTGESRPLSKGAGERVLGGAVNISDALIIRIERTGAATLLAGIRRLVERANAEKPALVQLADRYSSLFVVSVLALALGAAGAWMTLDASRALMVAVSVLVATCPCAFSLATPAALAVATGELARRGVVPTRGHTLESLARITDVVLDKTGTVTEGELRLVRIVAFDGRSEADLLSIAAALERTSTHPVARALAAAAPAALELRVNAVRHVTGNGVEADVDGVLYRLGSASFTAGRTAMQIAAAPSDTVVWLSANGTACAAFVLSDRLRAGARRAIEELGALGLEVHLLSGDASAPTRRVAAELGIGHVTAEATPDSKRDYVRALQRAGRRVAMVGDGVNDAPVLAQADVSLAMAGGTSLARAEADAVVLAPDLAAVADAVLYARRVLRVVRQNVGWAFAYNFTVLPMALLGLLTPWAASLGMSASSLVVILNALRLQSRGKA